MPSAAKKPIGRDQLNFIEHRINTRNPEFPIWTSGTYMVKSLLS